MNKIAIILLLILAFSMGHCNPFAAGSKPQPQIESVIKSDDKPVQIYSYFNEKQKIFKDKLAETFDQAKDAPLSGTFLYYLLICFLYGIFHALGPGHAKTLVSSYVMGSKINMKQTFAFGSFVALGHAMTAFVIVVVLFYIMKTPIISGFSTSSTFLSKGAYSIVLFLGLFMLYKKFSRHTHSHNHSDRGVIVSALAVGLIPCPGAMVLTIFAVTGGTVLAGFISVLAMAVGMAITITSVSMLTFYFRRLSETIDTKRHIRIHGFMETFGILMIISFSGFMLL